LLMEKDVFVISDLHIGDGGPRDNFGYLSSDKPQQLNLFLDYVSEHNGELIIIGDLFEFWQANFSRILTRNMSLIERLGQLKPTYIIGNHDIDLVAFIEHKLLCPNLFQNLSGPVARKIGDKTFYFMHGHEVDPYNKGEIPGKGRLLAIVGGMAESLVGSPRLSNGRSVESVLEQAGEGIWNAVKRCARKLFVRFLLRMGVQTDELSPAQNPDRASEMLLYYKADRDENRYDIAIVGHTHKPGRIGDWYFNSGSWATSDNNFIRITPDGKVQLFDWKDGRPVVNPTTLTLPETGTPTKDKI